MIKKYVDEVNLLLQEAIAKQSDVMLKQYPAEKEVYADYIFKEGNIITMAQSEDKDLTNPEIVISKSGRIVYVGKETEAVVEKWVGQKTKIINLKGKTMLPGFIDPHIHFVYAGLGHWVDLSPFKHPDMESVWNAVVTAVKNAKEQDWVMCHGYDVLITKGQQLDFSIQSLDSLSKQIPIFIMQLNGHLSYANSAAFKKSGITKQTPDPPGSRFVRDEDGNFTGRVQELAAMNMIEYHSPLLSAAEYIYYIKQFFQQASSKGCTSLHDCGIGAYIPELDYKAIQVVMKSDSPVRVSGFLISNAVKLWDSLGIKPQMKDELFRITGIKCWSDGSLQIGSGFLKDPYSKIFCGCGKANYSQETLNSIVLKAHNQGWQVGIHANGDAAIDMALEAYQNAQKQNYQPGLRHRIEHCTVCREDQLIKMKKLDVSPSFLIGHVYYYGQFFRNNILGQQRKIDPVNSALKNGLKISLHSDYISQPIDPLRCIHNAVTRKSYLSQNVLNEEERITVMQALKGMTIDAAWQCHTDDIVGSIQVGKCSDFVILQSDPLSIAPEKIIDIKVLQTWLGGLLRYQCKEQ